MVYHYDTQNLIDIYGDVQDRDLGAVADDINARIAALDGKLPKATHIVLRGQVQTMLSSYTGLAIGVVGAILLVYLLIVINFQSWRDPFIIITALPAAIAGIAWMLLITGTTLSVPALTGAIMCMGVATANSILVVSFARDRMNQGASALQAALDAGFTRFRPVLMTALAMMIGMLPMSLGMGEGGEQNAPLGPRGDRRTAAGNRRHAAVRAGGIRRPAWPPAPAGTGARAFPFSRLIVIEPIPDSTMHAPQDSSDPDPHERVRPRRRRDRRGGHRLRGLEHLLRAPCRGQTRQPRPTMRPSSP